MDGRRHGSWRLDPFRICFEKELSLPGVEKTIYEFCQSIVSRPVPGGNHLSNWMQLKVLKSG
jgi:hypothetical protein